MKKLNLGDLHDDLLLQIFSHVESSFLLSLISRVCKRWKNLALSPVLWRRVDFSRVIMYPRYIADSIIRGYIGTYTLHLTMRCTMEYTLDLCIVTIFDACKSLLHLHLINAVLDDYNYVFAYVPQTLSSLTFRNPTVPLSINQACLQDDYFGKQSPLRFLSSLDLSGSPLLDISSFKLLVAYSGPCQLEELRISGCDRLFEMIPHFDSLEDRISIMSKSLPVWCPNLRLLDISFVFRSDEFIVHDSSPDAPFCLTEIADNFAWLDNLNLSGNDKMVYYLQEYLSSHNTPPDCITSFVRSFFYMKEDIRKPLDKVTLYLDDWTVELVQRIKEVANSSLPSECELTIFSFNKPIDDVE